MEVILLLFFGYVISRALNGDDRKRRGTKKRRTTLYGDDGSYSVYDTWRRSHGDRNTLF